MEKNRPFDQLAFDPADALAEIAARNRIRLEAGLPLLSEWNELQRYQRIAEEARFKEFYETEVPRYAPLWDWTCGWMHNMRVYVEVRRRISFRASKGAEPNRDTTPVQ